MRCKHRVWSFGFACLHGGAVKNFPFTKKIPHFWCHSVISLAALQHTARMLPIGQVLLCRIVTHRRFSTCSFSCDLKYCGASMEISRTHLAIPRLAVVFFFGRGLFQCDREFRIFFFLFVASCIAWKNQQMVEVSCLQM